MTNSWTYRQYVLYRVLLGFYLVVHFVNLLPWAKELFSNQGMLSDGHLSPLFHLFPNILLFNDSPLAVQCLIGLGLISSFCFLLGKGDRYAALLNWYILTCLFDRNPFIANPSLPYIGWLLLAHVCLPKNSHHTWKMPTGIFFAAWLAMAVGYSYSGYTKVISPSWIDGSALYHVLHNPLARTNIITDCLLAMPEFVLKWMTWGAFVGELLFLPLAFVSRFRPWIWLALLGMHVSLLFVIRFADLSFGMIMLHLFTFNPAWIKPKKYRMPLKVFYDGSCGLCHRFVQFGLIEAPFEKPFIFAPLQGKLFQELMKRQNGVQVPDSIVVYNEEKDIILFKSQAIFCVLQSLGGTWRGLAYIEKFLPCKVLDVAYDYIAKIRQRLFKKPKSGCPMLLQEWKQYVLFE